MFTVRRIVCTRWKKQFGPGLVADDTMGYVGEGIARYVIGHQGDEQEVTTGNFIWLPASTTRLMKPVTKYVTLYSLQLIRSEKYGEQRTLKIDALPGNSIISSATNPAYVERLFKMAVRIWIQKPEFADLEIGGIVSQIVAQFLRTLVHNDLSPHVRLQVSRLLDYITSHFTNPDLTLAELAGVAGWSERYLISVFKEVTNETPMAYVTRLRINLSVELLSTGDFSVMEVSQAVGWSDPAYFSRVFSRHVGQPPSKLIGVETTR